MPPKTRKMNKLMEAAMAVLQATPDHQLKIVVLNKALFYLDLLALRDLGRMVTGQTYVALPNGPVVDSYKRTVVAALSEANLAEQIKGEGNSKPIRVVKALDVFSQIDASDLHLAQQVGASFTPFTSLAVSSFSHHNPGWIVARQKYVEGAPAPVIDMRLALQQLCDDEDDAWLDEPIDADVLKLCENGKAATTNW